MFNIGSKWRRWDPHIHAPGTILNDQFGGTDPWETYLSNLESLSPEIEVIGITDYYLTDTYQEVLRRKQNGRLANIGLIFPNVELRLDVAAKNGFVNLHLLVSPDDPNHVQELQRILQLLQFQAHSDTYNCTRSDLMRLGRRADPTRVSDNAALEHGATQFKVNFKQLRQVFNENNWAKSNILIAVAGATGDGTSGLRQAADATIRQEIEKFAHIIFSSSPAQRLFWCGRKTLTVEEINERYGGCKPCLHGSDAHCPDNIGQPDGDRFCWLKGGLEFDTLRQACIDPEGRAYVGSEPPSSAMPSQVIAELSISEAEWLRTTEIRLNPGLVAIIGSRGSGKTALADIIAAGCDTFSSGGKKDWGISSSFLNRAKNLIGDGSVSLKWGGGATLSRFLDGRDADNILSFPRARYLSQQFVEELCSSSGLSDGLIKEIERVVFEAFPSDQRDGAINFEELRDQRTARWQNARKREADAIADISNRVAIENEKEITLTGLTTQVAQKKQQIDGYTADLGKLVIKGTEAQAKRYSEISEAVQKTTSRIQGFSNQRRTFLTLQDEVTSTRATRAPELLRQTKERHIQSGMTDAQWNDFLLDYKGNVNKALADYINWVDGQINSATGTPVTVSHPNTPLFESTADLSTLTLHTLQTEMGRLGKLISEDQLVRDQYTALTQRIAQENSVYQQLQTRLVDAQGASGRKKELQAEREQAYGRVFQAIINEQEALTELYAPLMARIASSSGTLGRLSFSVRRIVDVSAWGARAEETLLDRRKSGPFQGRGSFTNLANQELRSAWETGNAADVQSAMTRFRETYMRDLMGHAPYERAQETEFRNWLKNFAHWLFSTDHISVRYEVSYDSVDIRKLSPGTRGIVLLLLYLALDDSDDRPLIIDQPEENLDPRSVYDELVKLFIAAKTKRQVIIVTHNANLVVNTDADQIIIAEAGPHRADALPYISYISGGLENVEIRKQVCNILEGGEDAFKERARRLRVRFER